MTSLNQLSSQSLHRVDAVGKITGAAQYPGDITPDNLLHGKILFSAQPHARMLAIDLDKALAVPGVIAIFTAKDVPVNEYGLITSDQPVLVGLGSSKPYAEISRWEGDQVAVIVAETEEAAAEARALIDVTWEPLPVITDIFEAMKDEVIIHPDTDTNVLKHYKIRKGDMDAGWAAADVVIEGEYKLPYQEHAYLQPEAAVSYIDEMGRITVEIAGQWTHEDREQIAHALGVPEEKVRVIYPAIGGAFGGREDMSLQIVMGLAAMRLHEMGVHRPLRIIWSRTESIVGHHKRHPAVVRTKWGATKEGKITAVSAEAYTNSGAYMYTSTKVLGNLHLMVTGPYEVPNAHIDSYTITTNNVPGGAFRGFGGPQGALAAETQMNKLAEVLGIDPVELRLRNVLREGSLLTVQTPIPPGVSMAEVVSGCAEKAAWGAKAAHVAHNSLQSLPANPKALRHGRGFACALKNIGFSFAAPESCDAIIELHGKAEIERVVLRHAAAEVGQGTHSALRQMAAAAVGVTVERVELVMSDTAVTPNSGSVSASRMTFMAGNAIRGAAEQALQAWTNEERPAIAHYTYVPPRTEMYDAETGVCMPNFSYGYVAEAVDLTVDVETGHIFVERVVCADDVGKAVNPQIIEGQIEGAVTQGFGYAVMEDLQVRNGRIQNPYFSQYLIPGIKDIPGRVDSVIMEIPNPTGPWGARGMAEMPLLPLAPAIIAALHDATGIWFDEIPLLPYHVIAKLRQHEASTA
ncbi:MAG: molybdopterin-dependent oxidoreductase [Ardenticatenaceae bacterium]|nr:molybdopterin-dependent oxidoreductase [Ardenticatenaceae bacterium]